MNVKTAISEQTREHLIWVNSMLEVQNEVLINTCNDLREIIGVLKKENEILKKNNKALKCTIQRLQGCDNDVNL